MDPQGLSVHINKITVDDKGEIFGKPKDQGRKLGPLTAKKTFSFGFKARIDAEIGCGSTIMDKDVHITQFIALYTVAVRNDGTIEYSSRDKSGSGKISPEQFEKRFGIWLLGGDNRRNSQVSDHSSSDPGGNYFALSDFARHGDDYIEWLDWPGFNVIPRLNPNGLPAAIYSEVGVAFSIRIVAEGTDHHKVEAEFARILLGKSDGNKWSVSQSAGEPDLPKVWE